MSAAKPIDNLEDPSALPDAQPEASGGPSGLSDRAAIPGALIALARQIARQAAFDAFHTCGPLNTQP